MSEEKSPDLVERLSLDIFMRQKASQYPPPMYLAYRDEDMVPDAAGGWYRRPDGTYGDWYAEIYDPAIRTRPRRAADRPWATWTADGEPQTTDTETHTAAPEIAVPQVERFRPVTGHIEMTMRACKADAKEILNALYKD